jgi:magnesium-protoporphyrin O-methyltransferase
MTEGAGGDEMESVKNYFDTEGFNRWKRIYGETDVRPLAPREP